jgi:CheY-like chemotaxis protein
MPSYPARVLLVDDSPVALAVLSSVFTAALYEVSTATHGEEGFNLALRMAPHVIVTDCVMPGVDGFGLLRLLRSHPATIAIPVVMLTSCEVEDSQFEAHQAQPQAYVAKVTPMEELLGLVREMLEALGEKPPVI